MAAVPSGSVLTQGNAGTLLHCAQVHAAPGLDLGSAERLYNPYEGISTAIDGRGLARSVYRLPKQPEFLFSEEAAVHKRSWSENMTYYTGLGYLSGGISWMGTLHMC